MRKWQKKQLEHQTSDSNTIRGLIKHKSKRQLGSRFAVVWQRKYKTVYVENQGWWFNNRYVRW